MRYLLLIFVAYYVIKSLGKLLGNLKIMDTGDSEIKGNTSDPHPRLRVDEDDIEDADFKEVD